MEVGWWKGAKTQKLINWYQIPDDVQQLCYIVNAQNQAESTEALRFSPLCSVGSPNAGHVFKRAITQPILHDNPWLASYLPDVHTCSLWRARLPPPMLLWRHMLCETGSQSLWPILGFLASSVPCLMQQIMTGPIHFLSIQVVLINWKDLFYFLKCTSSSVSLFLALSCSFSLSFCSLVQGSFLYIILGLEP